ncbi:hypothetical protein DFJ74DRAFT_686570 [Hyaloraphidium curvatum]|nr:hypothetical protein DFJ74DRAFT_686570 [Hyaloraphidium curvatum]
MGDPAPGQAEVCSAGQARIMEALARRWAAEPWQGKLRMVVVTSIGCGATKGDIPERVYSFLEPALRDKDLQEALLFHLGQPLASAIEWSIVRPGGLTDDPPRGYRSAPGGIRGVTTRADAAAYCLAVLEGREPAGNAAVSVISI